MHEVAIIDHLTRVPVETIYISSMDLTRPDTKQSFTLSTMNI